MIKKIKSILFGAVCASMCLGMVACGGTGDNGNDPGGTGTTNPPATEPVKIEEPFDFNNEEHINWYGRTYADENGGHWFNHSASGFEVNFYGTELTAEFEATMVDSEPNRPVLGVYVDGEDDPFEAEVLQLSQEFMTVKLAENLTDGLHSVKVLKRSETMQSTNALVSLETDGDFYTPPEKPERKLEFYGDSITCGYGITADSDEFNTMAEDGTATYAAEAARILDAQYNVIAGSGMGLYKSPYQSKTIPDVFMRVDFDSVTMWNFDYIPDAVIINLGTNDNSYIDGLYSQSEKEDALAGFHAAYRKFIENLNKIYPDTEIIAVYGMMAPKNAMIHSGFEAFIEGLKQEGLPVSALELPSMNDDAADIKLYHPGYTTHKKSGEVLARYLQELLAW